MKFSVDKIRSFQKKMAKHYQDEHGINSLLNKSIFKEMPFSAFAVDYLMKAHHEKLVKCNGNYVLYSANAKRTKPLDKRHIGQLRRDYHKWMSSTAYNRIYTLLFSNTPHISSYLIQKATGVSHSKISALRNHKQHIYNLSIQTATKLDNFYHQQQYSVSSIPYQSTSSDITTVPIDQSQRQKVHKEYQAIENRKMQDASYAKELLSIVLYKLKHSHMNSTFKDDLTLILTRSFKLYNAHMYTESIQKTTYVLHMLKEYSVLFGASTALQTGAYILHELHKANGLDNLAHSQTDLKADGIAALLVSTIECFPKKNKLQWLNALLTTKKSDTDTLLFRKYLLKVNRCLNKYLISEHLLVHSNNKYQLSNKCMNIIKHPAILEAEISESKVSPSLQKMLYTIILGLIKGLQVSAKYQKYAGLLFGFKLFDNSAKKRLSKLGSHSGKTNHMEIPWGLYRNIVLCSLDSIMASSKSSLTPSKAYFNVIKRLDNIDDYISKDAKGMKK